MQVAQWLIINSAVFILLFFSSLPLLTRVLIPFGYFFLFEYAILSRNYAIAILLAFCICLVMRSALRYKVPLYYVLLFLLANTHLLALILAGSVHLYFLKQNKEQGRKMAILALHGLFGLLLLLPTLYFIFPPSDSSHTFQAFLGRLHFKEQAVIMLLAPFRSFMPIPAWWEYHFWNTEFLLQAQQQYRFLRFVTLLVALALPLLTAYILKDNRKSLAVFMANLAVTLAMAVVFPLISVRYTGFIFIGFIVAYWLYTTETFPGRKVNSLVNIILGIQLLGSIVAIYRDVRYPFSNAHHANDLLKEVPAGKRLVTDFWCADMLSAYGTRGFYCVDLQRELSFLQWKAEYKVMLSAPDFYYTGMMDLFKREQAKEVYFITTRSAQDLSQVDKKLQGTFQLHLVDKREHAIERSSNLYLYRVKKYQ
jgi:hypothetical protein